MLEHPADRVDLDLLGQRELGVAVDVELEQRVRAAVLEGHHRLVARQGDVDRVVAVAVDDGGDLVLAADPASGALAELGALLGGDLLGGHGAGLLVLVRSGGARQIAAARSEPAQSITAPLADALAEATARSLGDGAGAARIGASVSPEVRGNCDWSGEGVPGHRSRSRTETHQRSISSTARRADDGQPLVKP